MDKPSPYEVPVTTGAVTAEDVEAVFVRTSGQGFNTVTKNELLRQLLLRFVDSLSSIPPPSGGDGEETPQAGNAGDIAVFGENNVLSGVAGLSFKDGLLSVPTGLLTIGAKFTPVPLATLGSAAVVGAGSKAIISDGVTPSFNNLAIGGGFIVAPVFSDGVTWKYG